MEYKTILVTSTAATYHYNSGIQVLTIASDRRERVGRIIRPALLKTR